MTQTQITILRGAVLRLLKASEPFGVAEPDLRVALQSSGFSGLTPEQCREHLDYMAQDNLVREIPNRMNPAIKLWRIAKGGVDLLAGQQGIE